jgi:hypothetical protein
MTEVHIGWVWSVTSSWLRGQITGALVSAGDRRRQPQTDVLLHRADGIVYRFHGVHGGDSGSSGLGCGIVRHPITLNPNEQWVISFDHPTGPTGYNAPPGPTMLDPTKATFVQARYTATMGGTSFPTSVQADVNRFVDIEFRPAGSNIWPVAMAPLYKPEADGYYVNVAGDAMTGALRIGGDPNNGEAGWAMSVAGVNYTSVQAPSRVVNSSYIRRVAPASDGQNFERDSSATLAPIRRPM